MSDEDNDRGDYVIQSGRKTGISAVPTSDDLLLCVAFAQLSVGTHECPSNGCLATRAAVLHIMKPRRELRVSKV